MLLVPLACSDDNNGGGGGGGDIPLDQLAPKLADATCTALATCGGEASFALPTPCKPRADALMASGMVPALQESVTAGRITYHGKNAQGCLDAIAGCQQTNQFPVACYAAVEGLVALGGDCKLDLDCTGASYCKNGGTCPGKCTAEAELGGACVEDDTECVRGLVCNDSKCVAPLSKGDVCDDSGAGGPCYFGLLCVGAAGEPTTCQSLDQIETATSGEACGIFSEPGPALPLCAPPDVCATAGGADATCKATVASGAACENAIPNQCPEEEFCDETTALCAPLPTAGEECVDQTQFVTDACAPGLWCDDSVTPRICKPLKANGADCEFDESCESSSCNDSKCGPDYDCG